MTDQRRGGPERLCGLRVAVEPLRQCRGERGSGRERREARGGRRPPPSITGGVGRGEGDPRRRQRSEPAQGRHRNAPVAGTAGSLRRNRAVFLLEEKN